MKFSSVFWCFTASPILFFHIVFNIHKRFFCTWSKFFPLQKNGFKNKRNIILKTKWESLIPKSEFSSCIEKNEQWLLNRNKFHFYSTSLRVQWLCISKMKGCFLIFHNWKWHFCYGYKNGILKFRAALFILNETYFTVCISSKKGCCFLISNWKIMLFLFHE